ncbi:HIT family protein [Propionicicella superfundia]|uniref:HIT family protein n=1 Tax=Propionicicella superfundia TaxID=348582 RepID=UPI0004241189|nr:HIT domain-containing protein [Propionicicella superfundia]
MSEEPTVEAASDFAGVPDAFGRLWVPHRMAYIGENKTVDKSGPRCPFCTAPGKQDADGLIVHRGALAFVVMNLYPYSPGHLLVCPYRHVAAYTDLTGDEIAEIGALTQQSLDVLHRVSDPGGFNLGVNLGAVAGAGIEAHLHQHIVPRWRGDMNFLPVVGQTRALPQLLEDGRQLLQAAWDE